MATRGSGEWLAAPVSTARQCSRYVEAAESFGVTRDGGEAQLSGELLAAVAQAVRPGRPRGHGEAWTALETHHGNVQELVEKDLTVVKVGDLLARRASSCPNARCTATALSDAVTAHRKDTVLLADPDPGREAAGRFRPDGLALRPGRARRRSSRPHTGRGLVPAHVRLPDLHPDHRDVIEGMEMGWAIFGGIFPSLSTTTSYLSSPKPSRQSPV